MILPPEDVTGLLIRRMAALYHRLGHEIGVRPLVLPDSKYFPDAFSADEASAQRIVRRMKSHAGMDDVPVKVRVVHAEESSADKPSATCCGGGCHSAPSTDEALPHEASDSKKTSHAGGGHCQSGGCGSCGTIPESDTKTPRLVDLGDEWLIQIPAQELGHDIVLTTNIAKALGAIFLFDTSAAKTNPEGTFDIEVEIAGTALGFGALLLEGSYLYSKSCGGPKIGRITTLSCAELAVLTALFVARGKHKVRGLLRHLGTTQAAAYREAEALILANREIVDKLHSDAGQLAYGNFSLRTSSSLWHRLFGERHSTPSSSNTSSEFDIGELEAMLAAGVVAAKRQRPVTTEVVHDDLRALVEDALAEGGEEA